MTTRTIRIQGDLVSLVDETVVRSIALNDWLPNIERRAPIFTPVLPTGLRGMNWDPTDLSNQTLSVLIEVPPQVMSMTYDRRDGTRTRPGIEVHRLSIPFTRFAFIFTTADPRSHNWVPSDYRVYWARSRYSNPSLADMTPALLPNVYADGRICFGTTAADANQSLADRIDSTVNGFFTSTFNSDLTIRYPNGWRNWTAWEQMSTASPNDWTTWPDLDPRGGIRSFYSWEALNGSFSNHTANRLDPVIANDGIPELPLGATFGRTHEWLNGLTPEQRARLAAVMAERTQP